jgi:hypothetical protein
MILLIPLILTSHSLISEAIPALAQKQLTYIAIATAVFFVVFFIPFRRLSWLIPFIYLTNIALLVDGSYQTVGDSVILEIRLKDKSSDDIILGKSYRVTKKSLRENVKIDEYLIFFHKIDIYGKSVLPTADSFC